MLGRERLYLSPPFQDQGGSSHSMPCWRHPRTANAGAKYGFAVKPERQQQCVRPLQTNSSTGSYDSKDFGERNFDHRKANACASSGVNNWIGTAYSTPHFAATSRAKKVSFTPFVSTLSADGLESEDEPLCTKINYHPWYYKPCKAPCEWECTEKLLEDLEEEGVLLHGRKLTRKK